MIVYLGNQVLRLQAWAIMPGLNDFEDWAQNFMHSRQGLHQLSIIPSLDQIISYSIFSST